MAGNKSKIVFCFLVLKFFNIQTTEGWVVSLTNVIWQVPYTNCIKVNTNGATMGSCVDIFRENQGEYVSSFSAFLRVQTCSLCRVYEPFMLWSMLRGRDLEALVEKWFHFGLSRFLGSMSGSLES